MNNTLIHDIEICDLYFNELFLQHIDFIIIDSLNNIKVNDFVVLVNEDNNKKMGRRVNSIKEYNPYKSIKKSYIVIVE